MSARRKEQQSGPIAPAGCFCREKYRLMLEFADSVREMGQLQDQQVQAIIQGDPDPGRFELLLHIASERKDAAKYTLIAHIEEHGCRDSAYTSEARTTAARGTGD